MFKLAIVNFTLLAVTLSAYVEFDNNLIEYDIEDIQPMHVQSISLPYPYQNGDNVLIQPAPIHTPNKHGVHQTTVIVPSTTAVEVSSPGLLTSVISCTYAAVKGTIAFFISYAPALFAGTILALGVCKLATLCSSEVTIIEAQRELRSIASPERLARAANFVREAVKKYSDLQ